MTFNEMSFRDMSFKDVNYKDILVYLDPTPASAKRLEIALTIVAVDGAHVTGADASTDAALLGDWREAAEGLEYEFHAALKRAGVDGEFRLAGSVAAASLAYETPVDLIVAPSPSTEARPLIDASLPNAAIEKSGAPVFVVPTDWAGGVWGQIVVIAWDNGREARRAVHDALPFLTRAHRVVVFVFSRGASDLKVSAERLVLHLQRRGISAEISDWTHTAEGSAVEAMFASVDTQNADLVVAGGFGQTRMFDGLFGSASLDLLRQPVMPVFMSH